MLQETGYFTKGGHWPPKPSLITVAFCEGDGEGGLCFRDYFSLRLR